MSVSGGRKGYALSEERTLQQEREEMGVGLMNKDMARTVGTVIDEMEALEALLIMCRPSGEHADKLYRLLENSEAIRAHSHKRILAVLWRELDNIYHDDEEWLHEL